MNISCTHNLLNSVFQSFSDAVVVTTDNHLLLYMNQPAEILLETHWDEAVNRQLKELLPFQLPSNGSVQGEGDPENSHNDQEIRFESTLKTTSRSKRIAVRISRLDDSFPDEAAEGYLIVMQELSADINTENIFTKIAESVTSEVGETFFHSLTCKLTEILDVDYCLLGKFREGTQGNCDFISAFARPEEFYLDIEPGTMESAPAEAVYQSGKTICYADNVRNRFPDDRNLKEWQIKGCAAAPLMDSDRNIRGVLIVLSKQPLDEPEIIKSVLQILAQRAAGEMARLQYEHQLIEERNRADEMNALKNNFLSNISHEVRTPLNTIIGFSNLLKEDIIGEQQQKYLTYIEEGGYRLLQTIDDILDLAVLETSPQSIDVQKTDLESELESAIGLFGSMARDKNISLKKIVHTPGVIVQADRKMLGQVLRKLIENAVKFTEQGSVMATMDLKKKDEQFYGIVRISDTGIGIGDQFLPHIFDEFMQESRGMGRKYEGVGLGLTIVKKIVGMMNGIIEVESEKGEGSVFTVYFPLES